MADLTLIDASGQSTTYNGVNSIVAPVSGGGTATFTLGGAPVQVEPNDVNFYDDYNGEIVASYSAADFAQLSALPADPSHTGMTAQSWNWTLSDAQAYVASYGNLDIGKRYTTSDGATRLLICLEAGRLSPVLGFGLDGTASVDWGDGSQDSTLTGINLDLVEEQHNYAAPGWYEISILPSSGSEIALMGDGGFGSCVLKKFFMANLDYSNYAQSNVYWNAINRVLIGDNCDIWGYAFQNCRALEHITFPEGLANVGNFAFQYCNFRYVSLVHGTTYGQGCFSYNDALRIVSFTKAFSTAHSMFVSCYALKKVTCDIDYFEQSAFSGCRSLANVTINSGISGLGRNLFSGCVGLGWIKFERYNPPQAPNSAVFDMLPTDCIIYVPTGRLSAYTSESNYPSSSTYTYVEY